MLLHDDLDEPVAASGGERIEPRDGASFRQDADQVAGVEPGEACPDKALPERDAWQGEAQDCGRGLHFVTIVPARNESQRLALRQDGLVRQLEVDFQRFAECATPAREVLRRLAVNRVEGHEFGPALGRSSCRDRPREGAIGGKG